MSDGEVFRPEGPISLEANTCVRIRVDADSGPEPALREARADEDDLFRFLRIMQEANLDGPPGWSERLHYYLYDEGARSDE